MWQGGFCVLLLSIGLSHAQYCPDGFPNCNSIDLSPDPEEDEKLDEIVRFKEVVTNNALDILASLKYSQDNQSGNANEPGFNTRSPRLIPFMNEAVTNALKILKLFGISPIDVGPDISAADIAISIDDPVVNIVKEITEPMPPPPGPDPEPNPGCNCTRRDYEPCKGGDGICSSRNECESMGGEVVGRCANCHGCSVCCKYMSRCQDITDKMITYFQNPGYPRTNRDNEACSVTINVQEEVCQVRLDFIDFEMAAPVCGDCSMVDNFQIINTAQPGGVLGPAQSRLCGLNSGQHMYVPVKPNNVLILKATTSGVLNVPLAAANGRNRGFSGDYAFRWNVRVTQVPCRAQEGNSKALAVQSRPSCRCNIPDFYKRLRAPVGCRQYFENTRGKIKSFNFDGQTEINTGLAYSICIRRPNDACGMTLNSLTFALPATSGCSSGTEIVDADYEDVCCTIQKGPPGVNFLGFPSISDGRTRNTMRGKRNDPNQNRYFFCGKALGAGSVAIGRMKGPLVIRVATHTSYWGTCGEEDEEDQGDETGSGSGDGGDGSASGEGSEEDEYCPEGGCLGFLISYDVDSGTC